MRWNDMYKVYYMIGNTHYTEECKRVYLKTELALLNVLTKDNHYKMIDLNTVRYFGIIKEEDKE